MTKVPLMTNRKSRTRFRLVPTSKALCDLEGPSCTLFQNTWLSEPSTKIWMKIDPHYQQWICSPTTLVSGNVRFMRICAGFPGKGASNDSRVIENVDFQGFRTLRLRQLRKWGQHYYIALFNPLSPFQWPQNTWPRMTLKLWTAILR